MQGVARVFGILTLIVVAVILADLVSNPAGTGALINGLTSFWKASLNAALGKAS